VPADMGLWSWLFPSDDDRLRRARAHIAKGRHKEARRLLLHCEAPEAEALYDQCSAAIDKSESATTKKRLAAEGFHGWRIEITGVGARRTAELEKLLAEEIAKGGVDLGMPDVDQEALKKAVARAQRRVRAGAGGSANIKLVPIVAGKGTGR
jgi:hypothetical protein